MNFRLFFVLYIFLLSPIIIISHTRDFGGPKETKTPNNNINTEQDYIIANQFIGLALESKHQENPNIEEDPKVTEFKIALELFGEFSKNGNFVSSNRVLIWLERNIEKFKKDFLEQESKKEIYFSTLNEVGISCAVGAIVYSPARSKNSFDQQEIDNKIKELDKSLARYLRFLVSNKANINQIVVNARKFVGPNSQWNKINGSLLHIAASTDRDDLISLLISLKSDPNLKDTNGRTPLHIAIENCKNDESSHVIEAILENGAEVNAIYGDNIKPLKIAMSKKLMKVAYILREKGANQKVEKTGKGWSNFF